MIRDGQYIPVNLKNNSVFSYIRKDEKQELLIVCNLSPKNIVFKIDKPLNNKKAEAIISNTGNPPLLSQKIRLQPCECAVYKLI